MAIKQVHICDGCSSEMEVFSNHRRLRVQIANIPGCMPVDAVKDVCSFACFLVVIRGLLPKNSPAAPLVDYSEDVSVDELDLSVRVANYLAKHKIHTVNQLCDSDPAPMHHRVNGMGVRNFRILEAELKKIGRAFGDRNTGITEVGESDA